VKEIYKGKPLPDEDELKKEEEKLYLLQLMEDKEG
jgi:hypothetical protein